MTTANGTSPRKRPCAFPNWLERNRFSHTQFSIEDLQKNVKRDGCKITVVIPSKEVAATIVSVITETVRPLMTAGIVSRLVVIDAASQDGTGEIATAHGAEVIQRRDIAPELGPSRGKGDALWRALLATDGDIVAFLDGDTCDPDPAHLIGIIGPLLLRDDVQMVRASFDRPFKSAGGNLTPHERGRVTEILARPLLNSYWPELSGFSQPLAGEFSARRDLLETLAFPVGYGVEIATLIDTYNLVGVGGMAQADVGCRLNSHQPLRKLAIMSQEIMCTAMRRAGFLTLSMARMYLPWENDFHDIETIERPPVAEYRKAPGALHANKGGQGWRYAGPPFIQIDGVSMFRDIGGYQTSDGSSVRTGLMFRSGELSLMTAAGRESFQKLAIGKIYDLRSPIEISSRAHGNSGHADSGVASPDVSKELESMFLASGAEVVAAPVFPDEEWLPQRRDIRLKRYASATHVRPSHRSRSSVPSNISTGLRGSIQANTAPRLDCLSHNLQTPRHRQPMSHVVSLLSRQRPHGCGQHATAISRRLQQLYDRSRVCAQRSEYRLAGIKHPASSGTAGFEWQRRLCDQRRPGQE